MPKPADTDADRPSSGEPPGSPPAIDMNRIDGQIRRSSLRKVGTLITQHPDRALAVIRKWLDSRR